MMIGPNSLILDGRPDTAAFGCPTGVFSILFFFLMIPTSNINSRFRLPVNHFPPHAIGIVNILDLSARHW